MNKTIIFFLLFFVIIDAYTQDFHKYEAKIIESIKSGSGLEQLLSYNTENGPSAIAFSQTGQMYISDLFNNRVVVFDERLKILKEIKSEKYKTIIKAELLLIIDNYIYGYYPDQSFEKVDINNGEIIYQISFFETELNFELDPMNFILYENYLFHYLKKESIICFVKPGTDNKKNLINMVKGKDVLSMFEKPEKYNLINIKIDENYRIFIDNKLITRDYDTFYAYWEKQNGNKKSPYNFFIQGIDPKNLKNLSLIGIDKNNNWYWCGPGYKRIYIFSYNGWLIDSFTYDKISYVMPAVQPLTGDIYFFNFDINGTYIHRIKNVWSSIIP